MYLIYSYKNNFNYLGKILPHSFIGNISFNKLKLLNKTL